jgi:CrcB protein
MWTNVGMVAVGGAVGAVARYGVYRILFRMGGVPTPVGTLVVNCSGSFIFGVVIGLGLHRAPLSESQRALLLVGMLGSFTTFSTYAFETASMLQHPYHGLALANMLAQNVGALTCYFLGLACARLF